MEIRSMENEEYSGEVDDIWVEESKESYKIGLISNIIYFIQQKVKYIHWDEFMRRNIQEKILILFFFILILFLISILILRFYWKKIK